MGRRGQKELFREKDKNNKEKKKPARQSIVSTRYKKERNCILPAWFLMPI
jgi:hypothetical protein